MKRLITAIIIALAATIGPTIRAASPADDVEALFNAYRTHPQASSTLITGNQSKNKDIVRYMSFTLKTDTTTVDNISRKVTAIGRKALDKEVVYRGGRLYYAFYMLPDIGSGRKALRSFLFYLDRPSAQGKSHLMVVYMETRMTRSQVKKMLSPDRTDK